MGIPAFKAPGDESDKVGESSKVGGGADVEVAGKCRECSVSLLPGLCESRVLPAGRKHRVNRRAQGVLVCASVSWLTSEGSEMEGERAKTSGGVEEGGRADAVVSWCVRAAGVSQVGWKKGKETGGVQKKKKLKNFQKLRQRGQVLKWTCREGGSCPGDPLHPESAMAFTDLCLVLFLPHHCLPPPPPPLSGNSLTLISKHLQKARRGGKDGRGAEMAKGND